MQPTSSPEARRTLPSVVLKGLFRQPSRSAPSRCSWRRCCSNLEQVPAVAALTPRDQWQRRALTSTMARLVGFPSAFRETLYELRAPADEVPPAALGGSAPTIPCAPTAAAARRRRARRTGGALDLRAIAGPAPTVQELRAVREEEECEQRQVRMSLREICMRLGSDRRFREWSTGDRRADRGGRGVHRDGRLSHGACNAAPARERTARFVAPPSGPPSSHCRVRRGAPHTGDDEHAFLSLDAHTRSWTRAPTLIATIEPELVERNEHFAQKVSRPARRAAGTQPPRRGPVRDWAPPVSNRRLPAPSRASVAARGGCTGGLHRSGRHEEGLRFRGVRGKRRRRNSQSSQTGGNQARTSVGGAGGWSTSRVSRCSSSG